MTPAPALTEATMDKMTLEQIETCRSLLTALTVDASKPPGQFLMKQPEWANRVNALCDLAKIALSPPPDVAGLCEELRGLAEKAGLDEWICRGSHHKFTVVDFGDGGISLHNCPNAENRAKHIAAADPVNMTKLLDYFTAMASVGVRQEKRIAELEAENGKLRETLKPFAIAGLGVPEDESDDELANAMFSNGEIRRAANLQGNGGERE